LSLDLDRYLEDTKAFTEEIQEAQRIKEAAKKGYAVTPDYERDPAPGYDGHIRDLVVSVVFGIWNEQKRPASLAEIYQGVRVKIAREQEDQTWPKIWFNPSKRTVDRRTNETARPEFYLEGPPPCICIRAGHYQSNPALFEKSVISDISTGAKA
jgi:hypothetical protein